MSWSFGVTDVNADNVGEALEAEAERYFGSGSHPVEAGEQAEAAARAALLLVPEVGGGTVNVTLNGHANPGHGDAEGSSPDAISVSVYRRTVVKP